MDRTHLHQGFRGHGMLSSSPARGGTPGKRTLTQSLPPRPEAAVDEGGGEAFCTGGPSPEQADAIRRKLEQREEGAQRRPSPADGGGQSHGAVADGSGGDVTAAAHGAHGDREGAAFAGKVADGTVAGFPDKKGVTTYDTKSGYTVPKVEFEKVGDKVKFKPTTSADRTNPATVLKVGNHPMPNETHKMGKENITFTCTMVVSADDHTNLVRAEQEHLDDYELAYQLTYKAAADAINELVGQEFASEKKAKDELAKKIPKLGSDDSKWPAKITALCEKSAANRDAKNTHLFEHLADGDDVDEDKKTLTYRVVDKSKAGPPSADIIKL